MKQDRRQALVLARWLRHFIEAKEKELGVHTKTKR
jgi:hypothetical protein